MGSYYPPNNVYQQQGYYYGQGQPPPPSYMPAPLPGAEKKKRGSENGCCLVVVCCICWCLVLVVLLAFMGYVYSIIHHTPQKPFLDVRDVAVKRFDLNDNILGTDMTVSLEVNNINTRIGLDYAKECSVNVMFAAKKISTGTLPDFDQPKENITKLNNIGLQWKSDVDKRFQDSLLKCQKNGRIPLLIEIKLEYKLKSTDGTDYEKKNRFHTLSCQVDVDNLKAEQKIKILEQKCNYRQNVNKF